MRLKLLIRPLERRDRVTLAAQRRCRHGPVAEVDLAVRLLLPAERVLHPVLVVTLSQCQGR